MRVQGVRRVRSPRLLGVGRPGGFMLKRNVTDLYCKVYNSDSIDLGILRNYVLCCQVGTLCIIYGFGNSNFY